MRPIVPTVRKLRFKLELFVIEFVYLNQANRDMNRVCFLALLFCGWSLAAQTNSGSLSRELFSTPQLQLRPLAQKPAIPRADFSDNNQLMQPDLPRADDSKLSAGGPWENSSIGNSFELGISNDRSRSFAMQYERLERGGYLRRPELPTENRLYRFVNATFEPEVIHLGKASVSCSLITALKKKNPLCLIDPIFFHLSW